MSIMMSFFKKTVEPSFEALIKNDQRRLYKIAYTYVRNEQDALDLVQEAVEKGYKSFHKVKDISFFSTWMTRILINCAIDFIRKRKEVIPFNIETTLVKTNTMQHADDFLDIESVFSMLKPHQKTLIILRFYEDYSIPEIAKIVGKPEGTIKSQLHRTLQKIKEELSKGGEEYGKAAP